MPPAFAELGGSLPVRSRGVGRIGSDESPPFERITGGNRDQLKLAGQILEGSGSLLVVERWFRHDVPSARAGTSMTAPPTPRI